MIKLFVTDLDGCISFPFQAPVWENMSLIRKLNEESRIDHTIPALSICTGRPYPYAEAVAQWLNVDIPFVFESAGLYVWNGNYIKTAVKDEKIELLPIHELRKWIKNEVLPHFPSAAIEFTKKMDAGVVAPQKSVIDDIHKLIKERVEEFYPALEIHITDVSVNVLLGGNNKLQGMKLLAEELNITLNEIAYIGDTGGDIPALKEVKMAFCPSNATRAVKDVSKEMSGKTSDAVLAAYREVIEYNRSLT